MNGLAVSKFTVILCFEKWKMKQGASLKLHTNTNMKSLNLIKPYFAENRLLIISGLFCLIIVDILQLFIPRIIKRVVDDLTILQVSHQSLLIYASYIILIGVMIGIFRYIWRRCLLGTSRRVEEGLRNKLLAHTQNLSASYFDSVKTGDLMAHATNDIQQVRMATGMGMVAMNDAVVLGTATMIFMAWINIKLTLLVLIPMPLIVIGTRFFSRKMHLRYQSVQKSFSDLTEIVRERFAGIRIIKAFTREKEETSRVEKISREYITENLNLVKVLGAFFPMMLLLSNMSLAIVLYFGGRKTIMQDISPGDFVAFISYINLMTWPMMALGWVTNLLQRGRASLERLNVILETPPGITDSPGAKSLTGINGHIVFENVSFDYETHGNRKAGSVLNNIDIEVKPGEILGIVGQPGSGKTTLLNLLPRTYDVSDGRIMIDGHDIKDIRVHNLRSWISFLPQEPFIFAGTIRHNLVLSNHDIKESDMIRAAGMAAVHKTIESFPDGYDTVVGEKGVILSGGQKQRIALARVFLVPTPILILDDPISQVDFETGANIIQTIKNMARTRTIVIVSHRLSALSFSDKIITLENGRIIESGNHHQLIRTNGYYAGTYRLQELEEDFHAI